MIEVNNLTGSRVDKGFLKKVAGVVMKGENKNKLDLSIALVSRSEIKKLNGKYRKKNKATDVLSFCYGGSSEVVLCLDKIKENSREYKTKIREELARTLIHGILHILGYNHQRRKEIYYLSKING